MTGAVSWLVRTDDNDGDHPLPLSRSVTPSKDGADKPRDRAWHQWPSCDDTFTHRDTHNAPESNKFNKNILFCWRHDPARRELMGDFYDGKTRITNGAFTLALSSQPLNWTLFMIDLTELDFYCSNFVFISSLFIKFWSDLGFLFSRRASTRVSLGLNCSDWELVWIGMDVGDPRDDSDCWLTNEYQTIKLKPASNWWDLYSHVRYLSFRLEITKE